MRSYFRFFVASLVFAAGPVIAVPTITLEGDANGAPHPDPSTYAKKFTGTYEHRLITGGIGHNLPQEAPQHPLAHARAEQRRLHLAGALELVEGQPGGQVRGEPVPDELVKKLLAR